MPIGQNHQGPTWCRRHHTDGYRPNGNEHPGSEHQADGTTTEQIGARWLRNNQHQRSLTKDPPHNITLYHLIGTLLTGGICYATRLSIGRISNLVRGPIVSQADRLNYPTENIQCINERVTSTNISNRFRKPEPPYTRYRLPKQVNMNSARRCHGGPGNTAMG